jgi:hypothetical protein
MVFSLFLNTVDILLFGIIDSFCHNDFICDIHVAVSLDVYYFFRYKVDFKSGVTFEKSCGYEYRAGVKRSMALFVRT